MNKFFLLLALISGSAQANWFGSLFQQFEDVPGGIKLQKLITLSNDRNENINYLNLMIDTNNLVAGLFNKADAKNSPQEGESGRNIFWLREIESPEGATLAEIQGRKAVIIKGQLNREKQEGRFKIRYLANGFTMDYEECNFFLKRAGNGWAIKNAYTNATISKAKIITWSYGISTIEGICPTE